MKINRVFTTADRPVAEQIEWKVVEAKITDGKTGKVVFHMPEVEVPAKWSQNAVNILAQKYLRKAGVPQGSLDGREENMPSWLWPRQADPAIASGSETSARQIFHRFAGCWTYWGWRMGLFRQRDSHGNPLLWEKCGSEEQAQAFYDETFMMLAEQVAAPNSPQWFNTGLHWAYGIEGPESGQWAIGWSTSHKPFQTTNSYERPQPHACFIQPVNDDLVNPGGINDLWTRESRLFKHGSGTGTNFSTIRGKNEKMSGGGTSSGLMSFLEVGDRNAGAIKSGGVTRRAAKMVIVNADHPEIEAFVDWKHREEAKAAAMYVGSRDIADVAANKAEDPYIPQAVLDRIKNGFEPEIFGIDWEDEAISSVSGQNSNNSVRVTNEFLGKLDKTHPDDRVWNLTGRTDGKTIRSVDAQELWKKICRAAWACGDPGLQFDTTINEWHTCAADGRINASNPCSEYMFLDDTACNLASLNLVMFLLPDSSLDIRAFTHAVRLWAMVLDISVTMASFPSREIALGSYNYRTFGLGYANLGGLLMRSGIPYDSDEGRALAAGITALLTGVAYQTSAEMADEIGPFPRWETNAEDMKRVLRNHSRAAGLIVGVHNDYEDLTYLPPYLVNTECPAYILSAVEIAWDAVLTAKHFRNAQVTLLAPTGTIAFVMDCDTTGIEPDFALVKTKSLAGGGTVKSVNPGIPEAMRRLGYNEDAITLIGTFLWQHGRLPVEGEYVTYVQEEHLPIFACANDITPAGHVNMVAAVQPFLSGAVSKTINMPNHATIGDVDMVYRAAHALGLKAVALYREGSKLNQPMVSTASNIVEVQTVLRVGDDRHFHLTDEERRALTKPMKTTVLDELSRGQRELLPGRRKGYTQKFNVDGQALYLRTGEWEDGRLGEIFVTMSREGSMVRSVMECFSKAVSIGLQYGVPPEEFVEAFIFTKFDPAGRVIADDHPVKFCSSVIDLIFRDLGYSYLHREDLVHVTNPEEQPEESERPEVRSVSAAVSGESCPNCGAIMTRTGTCLSCPACGENNGCS